MENDKEKDSRYFVEVMQVIGEEIEKFNIYYHLGNRIMAFQSIMRVESNVLKLKALVKPN
jgi:hypothetical protein